LTCLNNIIKNVINNEMMINNIKLIKIIIMLFLQNNIFFLEKKEDLIMFHFRKEDRLDNILFLEKKISYMIINDKIILKITLD